MLDGMAIAILGVCVAAIIWGFIVMFIKAIQLGDFIPMAIVIGMVAIFWAMWRLREL